MTQETFSPVKLAGQYIQVKREKNGEITYGGDQGFFAGAPVSSADERKRKLGCGITALGDIFLYLAGRDRGYAVKENEGLLNRVLSEEEYKEYYNRIYKFAGGLPAWSSGGLSFIRVQYKFNRMARREHWRLRARWGFCGGKIYERTREMLGRDIPVILCMPFLFGKRNKGQGITFYRKQETEFVKAAVVSAHYIIITCVIKEKGCVYLEISSWGKKYYIDWEEYDAFIHRHFLATILGNMLYIKSKSFA
ncbi:MAG: hypothetical protein NC400_05345 [Clostridium sp.]|nr:hypothetical protein [Clostridium sp.]